MQPTPPTTPPTKPRDTGNLQPMRSPEFRPRRSIWPGLLVAAAIAAGLRPRPIDETTRATIDWWRTLPAQRRAMLESDRSRALKPQREQELLQKWARHQAQP